MKDGGTLKLADFGWSIQTGCKKRTTICGTLDYMCPEIINKKTYDNNVDLWCLGILTFELLTGKPPFEASSQKITEKRIKKGVIKYPRYLSNVAKDFIQGFLKRNPSQRMSLEAVSYTHLTLPTKA